MMMEMTRMMMMLRMTYLGLDDDDDENDDGDDDGNDDGDDEDDDDDENDIFRLGEC